MLSRTYNAAMSKSDKKTLLDVALRNARLGLKAQPSLPIIVDYHTPALQQFCASVVTLRQDGEIVRRAGTVLPKLPLVCDVSHNAYEVACGTNRLNPDLDLTLDVQLVSPLQPIEKNEFNEILEQIEPRVHGVYLQHPCGDANFTPDMWEHWSEPEEFMRQLQLRCGIDSSDWKRNSKVYVYTVEKLPPKSLPNPAQKFRTKPK